MKPTAPAVTRPESNGNPTPSLQLRGNLLKLKDICSH